MSTDLLLTLMKIFLSLDSNKLFAKEERSTTEASSPVHYSKWSQEGRPSLHLMTQGVTWRQEYCQHRGCMSTQNQVHTYSFNLFQLLKQFNCRIQFNSNSQKRSSDLTRVWKQSQRPQLSFMLFFPLISSTFFWLWALTRSFLPSQQFCIGQRWYFISFPP